MRLGTHQGSYPFSKRQLYEFLLRESGALNIRDPRSPNLDIWRKPIRIFRYSLRKPGLRQTHEGGRKGRIATRGDHVSLCFKGLLENRLPEDIAKSSL